MSGTQHYGMWKEFIRSMTSPLMQELGVASSGTHLDRMNRAKNIMPLSCGSGSPICLENSTDLFLAWVDDKFANVHSEIRRVVYEFGMKHNSRHDGIWEKVLSRFEATNS